MSYPIDLKLVGGLTLHELLQELENGVVPVHGEDTIEIAMMPPNNACDINTDEDSGDENDLSINNLPPSQLLAHAEVNYILSGSDSDSDPEYNIPLARLQRKRLKKKTDYKWKKGDIKSKDVHWPVFDNVSNNRTPGELFGLFLNDNSLNMIVTYSNLYAVQKNHVGDITLSEMQSFIGILLLSGYNHMSRRRMYWETLEDTRNSLVSNALPRDRFEYIMSHVHCCDNLNLDQNDKYAKVRPLFDELNKRFLDHAPHLENHSIDESMVPYFGRHPCKQFIRGKPIRYGYKLWVGATDKGYMVWFEPYQGAKSVIKDEYRELGLGPSVVLEYSDVLSSLGPFPYHLFFDNFFTTIPLLEAIANKGMRGTGTIRENRMSKCPLPKKIVVKKQHRGFYDFRTTENNDIVVTTWNDNNIVNMASNAENVLPPKRVLRYSQKEKGRIYFDQPALFSTYNAHMGGVDRGDQNISLYRIGIRGKKWYFCLFAHCLDMCLHNAWQLHRHEGGKLDNLTFRRRIVCNLLQTNNKVSRKRSKISSLENIDSRYDRLDHLVMSQGKQTRCRVCHKKVSTKCQKCDVALHIDCFIPYHTKP